MADKFTTYKKACKCHATASGPHVMFKQDAVPTTNPDVQIVSLWMVPLACDDCHTPWEMVKA